MSTGIKIHLAVNDGHQNKMPNLPDVLMPKWWSGFNAGFRNIAAPPEVIPIIIKNGWAITTQHRDFRKKANFVKGQHIGLDFDGMGLDEIVDDFILDEAYMIHTTASHTEDDPHYRVLFLLAAPIHDPDGYADLSAAITKRYPMADQVCRDPARLFFGATECRDWVFGNIMPLTLTLKLGHQYRQEHPAYKPYDTATFVPPEAVAFAMRELVDDVLRAPDGEKHTTLNKVAYQAGGYVGAGLVTEDEAYRALWGAISQRRLRSARQAERTIKTALRRGARFPITPSEQRAIEHGVLVF